MRRIIQNYRAWGGDIPGIQSPAFVVNGDAEAVRTEHAMALARALPHTQLAILPGEHGEYTGEIFAADKTSQIPALPTAIAHVCQQAYKSCGKIEEESRCESRN